MSEPSLQAKIIASKTRLQELEREHQEAGFNLRTIRDQLAMEKQKLYELIDLMAGKSPYVLPGFQDEEAAKNGTDDEHQRGPTSFPDMQEREAAADAEPQRSRRKKKAGQGDASIAP